MALGTYTSVANVEASIGTTFGTATTPTTSQVETWINWASDSIESLTNQVFGIGTTTNELIDFNRYTAISNSESGYLEAIKPVGRNDYINYQLYNSFRVANQPVTSIITLEKNENSYPSTPSWSVLTPDTDFIYYPDTGLITIVGNVNYPYGKNRFRVSYTYGTDNVPGNVQRLATLMVTKNILESKVSNANFGNTDDIAVGEIRIKKSGVSTRNQLEQVNQEINRLIQEIGDLKTFII